MMNVGWIINVEEHTAKDPGLGWYGKTNQRVGGRNREDGAQHGPIERMRLLMTFSPMPACVQART